MSWACEWVTFGAHGIRQLPGESVLARCSWKSRLLEYGSKSGYQSGCSKTPCVIAHDMFPSQSLPGTASSQRGSSSASSSPSKASWCTGGSAGGPMLRASVAAGDGGRGTSGRSSSAVAGDGDGCGTATRLDSSTRPPSATGSAGGAFAGCKRSSASFSCAACCCLMTLSSPWMSERSAERLDGSASPLVPSMMTAAFLCGCADKATNPLSAPGDAEAAAISGGNTNEEAPMSIVAAASARTPTWRREHASRPTPPARRKLQLKHRPAKRLPLQPDGELPSSSSSKPPSS
mmetsp:Transcript_7205/g.20446  ORF Transcript_7205/g.20446 Transcript_7205/m.20446 type:complete len:290 (+) Transcript_7205:59-928(+)